MEKLKDENQVLHIGTTQCIQKEQPLDGVIVREEVSPKITNLVQMMDFSQALFLVVVLTACMSSLLSTVRSKPFTV